MQRLQKLSLEWAQATFDRYLLSPREPVLPPASSSRYRLLTHRTDPSSIAAPTVRQVVRRDALRAVRQVVLMAVRRDAHTAAASHAVFA